MQLIDMIDAEYEAFWFYKFMLLMKKSTINVCEKMFITVLLSLWIFTYC